MPICNTANQETRTRKGPIRCRAWLGVFSLSAFFGMSCSIKDAFPQAFPEGVIFNSSTHCDVFDVSTKVRKFMITAFLKMQDLKYCVRRNVCYPLWLQNMSGSQLKIFAFEELAEPSLDSQANEALPSIRYSLKWRYAHSNNSKVTVPKEDKRSCPKNCHVFDHTSTLLRSR